MSTIMAKTPSSSPALQYEMISLTHTGRVREHNEDAVAFDALAQVAVLADGMGGYAAGEVASGMATAQICARIARLKADYPKVTALDLSTELRFAVRHVNAEILRAARSNAQYAGMGATLVAVAFTGNVAVIAHAGDSRAYLLRQNQLRLLTHDHSALQEQIDMGLILPEDAETIGGKNLVTRALGVDARLDPDVAMHPMMTGDLLLLCSDGLNDMLTDAKIENILRQYAEHPAAAARQLVDDANVAGGRDNVSVILVTVR
ncbi:Stp1/IreP family PP2C-type Ser/Thr phosphatase [Thiomonas arsenitoxydans]|jgi:protein phosphatase|uniref:Stp1/IreP family PP2C-type Ser/Thr phosphatase n=1 Tax=Thiomonas arsenitoxydans (strain DSM 22701 / CIP 110005 / 3As) TaxID=426114 RepID=UPI0023F05E2E|nr:Stp1/IreP family PP2C-type Ser/Thr phosphatase [Thiomonas arsenitoxydans]